MAEENVELAATDVIRGWVDAWNRDDLDAFLSFYDGNAELITDPFWLDAGTFRGYEAIRGFVDRYRDSFTGNQAVIVDLLAGGDTVVIEIDLQGRGRTSGISTDVFLTFVNKVERGKIMRQQAYLDRAEALEAAGLAE